MEEGQCGTYLRLTRASSGPQVSVAKTYRDENENEYFGQITVAFLSSRILYSSAEEGHCDLAEIFILVFVSSIYVLATLTRGPDDALVSLR